VVQEDRVTARKLLLAAALAALCAVVVPGVGGAANECRGIPVCISVPGPWVIVPAGAEAQYLLECPRRRGVVGGVDALATSPAVRVSFEGRIGSPVSPGTTTSRDAFFRALSSTRPVAAFQPFLGCIPAGGGGSRSTTAAPIARPGVPVEHRAKTVKLAGRVTRTVTQRCARGEQLVGSWHALAFRTPAPPTLSLAGVVKLQRRVANGTVTVRVLTSEGVPAAARAEVQVGAVCAP
jgi:hypothetical protein